MVCDGIDGPFSSMIYLSNILDSGCLPFSSHARRFCSHDECHGSCTLIEMPVALLNHLDSWQSHFYIYIYLFSFDPWQDRDPFQDLFVHGRTGLSGRFSTFISAPGWGG